MRNALLAGLLFAPCAFGQVADSAHVSRLPIDVPKSATIEFEADAPGSELMPVITQFLNGDLSDPTSAPPDKIKIKTGFGEIELRAQDVAELLRPIHELHIVIYSGHPMPNTFRHYEEVFTAEGMKKEPLADGAHGVLLMHRPGAAGFYALVSRQKERVTVVRTDGFPELGEVGKVILRSLGDAAQKAVFHKK
jgi:hypothetical protein